MPIPRQDFDEAAKPLDPRIVDILSKKADQALSFVEVVGACEGLSAEIVAYRILLERRVGRSETEKAFQEALERLHAEGRIAKVRYQGEDYYAIAKQEQVP